MRVIFAILTLVAISYGSLSIKNSYKIDTFVVDSLDIPRAFLHSKNFLQMKRHYERYKKHHFFDVKRTETYFIPYLVKIINAQNVPDVFLFMAMAESNFATHARSRKRAIGIWQFMPATAKKFGLRVDEFVDERKDPYKSTLAAIRYLKYLHKMFGKWYLAALAYNAGEGTVQRAIKRAGSDDLMKLLDEKRRYLPKESRNYLKKIVLLALMANDPDYRLSSELSYILSRGEDYDIIPVKVKGAELLDYVAQRIQLRYRFIKELNPHILRGFTPPDVKEYTIYIPKLKYFLFKKRYRPSNKIHGFLAYGVKKGDSLYKIAKRFGVKIALIKRFNHLRSNILHIGEKLYLPIPLKSKHIYRVKRGDTILKIARKFGVNAKKLKIWNDKKDNFIKVGEKLVILF